MSNFEAAKREFRAHYSENQRQWERARTALAALLELLLSDQQGLAGIRVSSRLKTCDECIAKFDRKYRATLEAGSQPYAIAEHISDIIGLRVICMYEDEIANIHTILKQEFDELEVTDKTSEIESSESSFGYKGLHLDLRLNSARGALPEYQAFAAMPFEVQIRTVVQDAWSTLDHAIKYKKQIPHSLKRRIHALAALFEIADREFRAVRDQIHELATKDTGPTISIFGTATLTALPPTAFNYLHQFQRYFPKYQFKEQRVDGFVDEIRSYQPPVDPTHIADSLGRNHELLLDYSKYQWIRHRNVLNPFTIVRHSIYLFDRDNWARVLFDQQRQAFNEWLSNASLQDQFRNEASRLGALDGYPEPFLKKP